MADFDTDYAFMMANEDRAGLHAIVPDAPPGAYAISGINSAAWPAEFDAIAMIPQNQRGPAVEAFYQAHFWNVWESQLSDTVAERVLDMAVNAGPGIAVRLLQQAINNLGGALVVDGAWGPATVAAANACDQTALVGAYRIVRQAYYQAVVDHNPASGPYLPGWEARATE